MTEPLAERVQDARETVIAQFDFLGGHCAWSSTRGPGKDGANEDALQAVSVDGERGVLVLADGVGGQAQGEHASACMMDCIARNLDALDPNVESLRDAILNAIESCNIILLKEGRGSATTVVVLEFNGRTVRPYHVGDSSVFIVGQRGRIHLRTLSHAPVAMGIESGVLEPSAATEHDERHYVSNIVGTREMRIEVGAPFVLSDYDTVLLCSDGLNDNLPEDTIVERIRKGRLAAIDARLRSDCAQAMQSPEGHPDDLSLVLFRIRGGRAPLGAQDRRFRKSS